jgi:Fe-S-cluster containining protein
MTPENPSGRRSLQVDLETPLGRIQGNLPVPPGEIRLSELAWMALPLGEKLIGMAVKADVAQGRSVSCRKGCGACCRQAVPVSLPEAWMLADLVMSMPPPRRKEILARFESAGERLQTAGLVGRDLVSHSTQDQFTELGLAYFRLGIPCPFLADESCSIHPQRPHSCREYLVTSPAENCGEVGKLPVRVIPIIKSISGPLAKVAADFLGGDPVQMPMTLALAEALERREEGQRRFDAVELFAALLGRMFPESPAPASC